MYAKFFKRLLDFILSATALAVLSPIILILTAVGAIAMHGNPFFTQPRPGKKDKNGNEKIFRLIKFRTMSNATDKNGNLLPDEQRLGKYGRFLRSTSLDELPELLNILAGQLAVVGPRPQLVRDMTFMTPELRRRHDVRPGLTGLAQVNGRNSISWDKKFAYDLEYIDRGITFVGDVKIIFKTFIKLFSSRSDLNQETAIDLDYGDWLVQNGVIDKACYDEKQKEAIKLLRV